MLRIIYTFRLQTTTGSVVDVSFGLCPEQDTYHKEEVVTLKQVSRIKEFVDFEDVHSVVQFLVHNTFIYIPLEAYGLQLQHIQILNGV